MKSPSDTPSGEKGFGRGLGEYTHPLKAAWQRTQTFFGVRVESHTTSRPIGCLADFNERGITAPQGDEMQIERMTSPATADASRRLDAQILQANRMRNSARIDPPSTDTRIQTDLGRIADIDRMFRAAKSWGSWMMDASKERESLVRKLASEGIKVAHKNLYVATPEDGHLYLKIGDRVRKTSGYPFPGEVRSVITKRDGREVYAVECTAPDCAGMLHIFARNQLELASHQ